MRKQWKEDALLLFVVFVWGINFPILKAALATMHPHVLNVFRMLVSLVVLGGFHYAYQQKAGLDFWQPLREHGKAIVALGLLGYVLYQFFFIVGIDFTTAGNAALIMSSVPLWTALLSHFLRIERVPIRVWMGLVVILAGTATIVLGGTQVISLTSDTFLGNLLMIGAACFWGAYTALSKPMMKHVSPMSLTFLGLLVVFPVLVGIAVPYWETVQWEGVNLWVWLAILFSGGLSTGIAVGMWSRAVLHLGPAYTSAFGNMVPLIALAASVIFLGEALTVGQIIGGSLVLGGLLYVRHVRLRKAVVSG